MRPRWPAMRIRTQLIASAALAGAVAIGIGAGLLHATQRAEAGFDEQADADQVARGVASMLALTNEFTVFGGERVALQWRSHHAALVAAVTDTIRRRAPPTPGLVDLKRNLDDLPPLFETLAEVDQAPRTALSQRRRELLLERLIAGTQEVLETRHRWALTIAEARRDDQRIYTSMVLAAPGALLLLLLSLGLLVGRRVLVPLERLQTAVTAMQRGELGVRCASDAADELGDAARAVDAMALSLQRQSAALEASERRLRLVTDNAPALIAHVDAERRYTFVNARFGDLGSGTAASMPGRTMAEVHGGAVYARLEPHVDTVLAGGQVVFETSREVAGRIVHRESTYVPDVDASGRVQGFFALGFDVTARREAELRLEASERLLANVTDNITALVAYIDRDHVYRFANSKYREWVGVEPAAMVGRHVRDAMGADFYAYVRPRIERALAGELLQSEGLRLLNGDHRHHLNTHSPDVGPDGQIRGCFVLSVDISERHAAEQAVARSEQRLQDLTNSIPAMVGYFDMQERCQYANDAGLRAQGIERSEVPGIALRAVLGETDYAQHEPYVKEALAGRRARFQGRIPFDGRDAHFQAHLIPDRIDGGDQRGFYLMSFDITALKEAQQEQARVERQLRGITDNLPVLITYIDRDRCYRFANATCREWLGVEPAGLVGRSVGDAMGHANYEQRRGYMDRALAGERLEFEIVTPALGVTRHLHSTYVPDIQPDGSVAGIITLTADVSAAKATEQQLSDLARVDGLTGLPNRRRFEEKLAEGVARAARARKPVALMFLDIDHFKKINDTLGHAGGDSVLQEFAARLRRTVRSTDTPARLAGDEFVVLLEGLNAIHEAGLVAEKVVSAMRKPFQVGGEPLTVTTSLGVAFCSRPGPHTQLMECADEALYDAKGAGRNTFQMRSMDPIVTGFGELHAVGD